MTLPRRVPAVSSHADIAGIWVREQTHLVEIERLRYALDRSETENQQLREALRYIRDDNGPTPKYAVADYRGVARAALAAVVEE